MVEGREGTVQGPLLTIAIPTCNNFNQLADCLHTLNKYNEYPYKIVVVNNGAAADADGRPFSEQLEKACGFPVKIIQNDHNLGWERSINMAFEQECETELFMLLNDDVVFVPQHGFLSAMCKMFWDHSDIGAIGPSSNFVMGSQHICNHESYYIHETTFLAGFCIVIRSKLFSEIGGLDEGLPGGDDLDLSILIRKMGYKLIVNKTCFLFHWGAQTGTRLHPSRWNSLSMVDTTNNAIIRKHGVKEWYYCIGCHVIPYHPLVIAEGDAEGDWIRDRLDGAKHVLDVGCGANKTWKDAVGVDLRPRGSYAGSGGAKWAPAETDLIADVRKIPVLTHSQDAIIARHILEHIIDPFEALHEWRRCVRPGGILLIAVPNEDKVRSIILDSTHVHAYTRASLSRLVSMAGFIVVECEESKGGSSIVLQARSWENA